MIWEGKENIYGFFIAYNGVHVDTSNTKPNWERLRQHFSHIILQIPFDYQKQLAFGILYIEEKADNIPALLQIDFDDYFIPLTGDGRRMTDDGSLSAPRGAIP